MKRALTEYVRKRNFTRTAEPRGMRAPGRRQQRFVVQKHAASRLHYDFRLELNGTLKSWAVPKGIPVTKGERRLAVQVEDHPVAYIDFEGTIPAGEYGGGTVMVWDRGTYAPLSNAPLKELTGGKLHFVLAGAKLQGEWYLVRLRDPKQWLLIRGKDDLRPVSKKLDNTSALSGKSMAQLTAGDRVWHSRPATKPARHAAKLRARAAAPVAFVEPMRARLVKSPPPGDWLYEVKFDGFRALALKRGDRVQLLSRNEKDFGRKFPEVAAAVGQLPAVDAIVDGEIVALDPQGRSSFQLLQAYDLGEERPPIFFYVFDLLQLNGHDLRNEPLTTRQAALADLLKTAPAGIRLSAALPGPVSQLLRQVRRLGLEGLIGKRADSGYEAGARSGAWIKIKLHREQEMVIGGYTTPTGSRQYFGALLVGFYENQTLRFAGKVGTGFNATWLKRLHEAFQQIRTPDCPFTNLPEPRRHRYGQSLTPAELKRCHWVKPRLVCQVKFAEWTQDRKLRQPVFLGLRPDKPAREVVCETPA